MVFRKRKHSSEKRTSDHESSPYSTSIYSHLLPLPILQDSREYVLSDDNDLTLACGELVRPLPEDNEFVYRLIRLEADNNQLTCVQFGRRSFNLLMQHRDIITNQLFGHRLQALIFQNFPELQVYAKFNRFTGKVADNDSAAVDEGKPLLLHFANKEWTTVSLDHEEFVRLGQFQASLDKDQEKWFRRHMKMKRPQFSSKVQVERKLESKGRILNGNSHMR